MRYRTYEGNDLALSDQLALDRTRLANERTFLAYLRAAILIAVSSVTIIKLFPEQPAMIKFAQVMLPVSALLAAFGVFRCVRLAQSLRRLERNTQHR